MSREPGTRMQVVGVTGTNGKTSITYLVQAALEACGVPTGLLGTLEASFGGRSVVMKHTTPEAPDLFGWLGEMADAGMKAAAIEVSSHGIALRRCEGLDLAVGIFTNLSPEHLDYHGSMENYGAEKLRMFTQMLPESRRMAGAVVNADDPWGQRIAAQVPYRCLRYALDAGVEADVRGVDVQTGLEGSRFVAVGPWGQLPVATHLVGRHNVSNILSVLSAAWLLGLDVERAAAGVAGLRGIAGRLERVENRLGIGVWVDYCHTPDSMEKVLVALRESVPGRLIIVFGAGGDRDRKKRPLMGAMAERFCQLAVCTSDNPRTEKPLAILDEVLSGMSEGYRFTSVAAIADRRLAIEAAIGVARPGDGVLIGGKGAETYQIVGTEVHHFDDREVAREVLERHFEVAR
ncbi:MAG: UDP-N-acetylmuramoyl-L-alanyl-D-glutamate--2,6-diaminopimelate ligase [Deltaproteobacteria bacterium]|nr:UDP-N-acetylmuramoyl-L-alanyl-D-glutamate--2,6-diaminopimelate ligase [Deltaproteobacteria bacterium]